MCPSHCTNNQVHALFQRLPLIEESNENLMLLGFPYRTGCATLAPTLLLGLSLPSNVSERRLDGLWTRGDCNKKFFSYDQKASTQEHFLLAGP